MEGRCIYEVVAAVYVQVVPTFIVHAALEASLDERHEAVGIGQVRERKGIVAAAGQQRVYNLDERRQLFAYLLRFALVPAEESVEGETGLGPVVHEAQLLDSAAHLDAVEMVAPGGAGRQAC